MRNIYCFRPALLAAALCCATITSAQLVFIPDVQLRAWFNTTVPGCVDVDGYLDTSLPALAEIDTVEIHVYWLPFDLTGLENLTGLEYLRIDCADHSGTINAWPPNVEYLDIQHYAGTSFPSLPANLREFLLTDIPLTELPALPGTLERLFLGAIDASSIGPFPDGMERLELYGIWPQLTEIVSLPSSLLSLHLLGFADSVSFNCLPQLPDGMELLFHDILLGPYSICIPNIPTNPDFVYSGLPFPLCTGDCEITTGLIELEGERLTIRPNPVEDVLVIEWAGGDALEYAIVDATGRVVSRSSAYGTVMRIPVEMLSSGHYVLVVMDQGGRHVAPFMKR